MEAPLALHCTRFGARCNFGKLCHVAKPHVQTLYHLAGSQEAGHQLFPLNSCACRHAYMSDNVDNFGHHMARTNNSTWKRLVRQVKQGRDIPQGMDARQNLSATGRFDVVDCLKMIAAYHMWWNKGNTARAPHSVTALASTVI